MRRVRRHLVLVLCGIMFGLTAPCHADTMTTSAEATTPAASGPRRGLSMEQVRASYGVPAQELAAVGDPPITRWIYDDYTVYFEYQSVIHAVRHR